MEVVGFEEVVVDCLSELRADAVRLAHHGPAQTRARSRFPHNIRVEIILLHLD